MAYTLKHPLLLTIHTLELLSSNDFTLKKKNAFRIISPAFLIHKMIHREARWE